MRNIRLIARLDVKAPNLVKGIQMEGLRKIGNPNEFARNYYLQHVDEIVYIDIVASLYERNNLSDIVEKTTRDIFVPITVGGGLRTSADVEKALRSGADKVAINTAALKSPELIKEISNRFGSQCMVLSIEAKKNSNGWEAYYDNGREHSGKDVVEWARIGQELGAGEILLTSVDQEGTAKGFDIELTKAITNEVTIPVIASGGMGTLQHATDVVIEGNAEAVAMANVLHYGKYTLDQVRTHCLENEMNVRKIDDGHGEIM